MTPGYPDSLFNTPQTLNDLVSPNGKWVAWSWNNIDPTVNVYVAPADGSREPLKLTNLDQDVYVRSWSWDGKSLIVGHDTDGDERVRLFLIDIDKPGELKPLTDEKPEYFLTGGHIDPKRKFLIYGANYDFARKVGTEPSYVYKHDLVTGERHRLSDPKKPGFSRPQLSSTGAHIIYSRSDLDPSGQQLWLIDIEKGTDREILNFGDKVRVGGSWTPDGEGVVFIAESDQEVKTGIWKLGDESISWLSEKPGRNIASVWMPWGSDKVVLTEINDSIPEFFAIDPISLQETRLDSPKYSWPIGKNGDQWICHTSSSTQPGEIVAWSPESGNARSITEIWKRVPYTKGDLVDAESIHWKSSDGQTIQGWLYRAKNPKGTIVDIHGGPTHHDDDTFQVWGQYLVASGFNVLHPNYRGSTGFGPEFEELIKKDGWGGLEQEDIASGIRHLIELGIAEKGKVGVTGTSYGGYSSWFLITHYPKDLVAAAAPICGMTDLVVDYETTRPDLRTYSEAMLGGSPTQVPEKYRERSPIHFIENIEGKLLIIQGATDPNVTMENVRAVETELKKHNKPYEILVFEDEGHGIDRPKNKKLLLERLVQFFDSAFNS